MFDNCPIIIFWTSSTYFVMIENRFGRQIKINFWNKYVFLFDVVRVMDSYIPKCYWTLFLASLRVNNLIKCRFCTFSVQSNENPIFGVAVVIVFYSLVPLLSSVNRIRLRSAVSLCSRFYQKRYVTTWNFTYTTTFKNSAWVSLLLESFLFHFRDKSYFI